MKIYVDLVFFINFFFDLILLLTVKIILKRNIKIKRIILGSLVGALSIFFLFIKLSSITLFLLKVIISIFMIIITFGIKDKNYFIKNILYLYFISIILGGFLYYLNLEFSYKTNGLIFINNGFSINFIVLIILSPIILYLYIKQNKEIKHINTYYHNIEIYYKNKKYSYIGYVDTGNKLYDPYFHKPIILLYNPNLLIEKPIYIPYKTVDVNGLLEGFKPDKVVVDGKEINKKIIIALSRSNFKMDGVEVILHKDIF